MYILMCKQVFKHKLAREAYIMNFEHISKDLLDIIGGKNIVNITHCATRLRINVKNIDEIDTTKIKKVDGVLGVVEQGDTLQIIFGPNVQ